MRIANAFAIASCAMLIEASGRADAQPRDEHSASTSSAWSVKDVLDRVDRMDPRLRVKAAEQRVAHIAKRRAQWNRVQGRLGLHAGHQVTSTGWLATERMAERTDDQATAALVAEVRLPLYAGGRISAELEAADAQLRLTQHDEEVLRRQLGFAAVEAFAEALAADEQARVAEHALTRAMELIDMTRKKRSAGIDTDADVARAELNLIRYEEDAAVQRGSRITTLTALRSVLLLDERSPLKLSGSLSALSSRGAPGTHPELARAHAALEEARAQQHVAEAEYLPTVELFALGQYGNTMLGAPTTPTYDERWGPLSGSAAVGLRAGWTVFDFFVTRDHVAIAEAETAARHAEREVTTVELRNRRHESLRRERAAEARLRVLEGGRRVASRAVDLARARYETGNATLTEVLDAELEAIRLETNRVQAGLQLVLAHIDRMYAEGSRP
jgi:multidrug efflux system outer membrane protein